MKKLWLRRWKRGALYMTLSLAALCAGGCSDISLNILGGDEKIEESEDETTAETQTETASAEEQTSSETTTGEQTSAEDLPSETATERVIRQSDGGVATEEEQEEDAEAAASYEDEYILPNSNTEYLTRADLEGLNKTECMLARNEIYARRGRLFQDEEIQAYFDSCSWYHGTIAPEDFTDDMLNAYEQANKDLIVQYEQEMGYK